MQKQWNVQKKNLNLQKELSEGLGVHPIIAQLLINREIIDLKEAKDFLSAEISDLHDPTLLKNMEKAVARVNRAKENNERVLIAGDYDVDGVTSSVLLNNVLTELGVEVLHHIPHRMDEGYGLNKNVVGLVKEKAVKLVITVDCGITAFEEVKSINNIGVDVIVIDHHEPDHMNVPEAYAIINPKQKDCPYPFKHLAAVGLVAKFAQALLGEMSARILDLTAIGTVADVVPLRGENRIFVKRGLPQVMTTKNKGLLALMDVAKITGKKLSPFHIGFILGPRINAAGRMDSAHVSLDLFLSNDSVEAYDLAQVLDRHNMERKKVQERIADEAFDIVETQVNFKDQKIIVVSKEGWHKGVLGIVASRLTDKYYRPAIVISVEDGVGTASARSIEGFHIFNALQNCEAFLEEFGGHAGAAGLTIKEENIDSFRALINEAAHDVLEVKKLVPTLSIDCEIPLSNITMDLADIIDSMEPFGEGNPVPIFCSRNVTVKTGAQVLGRNTLKFWVSDNNFSISAVGFGMGDFKSMIKPGKKIDLVYEIGIDDWNKAPTPQLMLKDIRVNES